MVLLVKDKGNNQQLDKPNRLERVEAKHLDNPRSLDEVKPMEPEKGNYPYSDEVSRVGREECNSL